MNFTKTKKVVAAGLSALMMMTSTTSVFAAESGDKSANLNYQVSSSYDWIIHSSIDFGADAGVGKTVDRTGNQVKVLKNVIPEGKYLNISVKGSGANDAFTVDNGGSEVLNYDVSDDNGAVGVNGNVLSVPAGTNTATQNMNFKLNTKKGSAEIAGNYNGHVIYNAEVGEKKKEKSSTIIGTVWNGLEESEIDTQFGNVIPEQATTVTFTDEVAPKGVSTTDLTVAKDRDVVGWLDGTTWKVSTQDSNKAVTFNGNCAFMFASFGRGDNNKLSRLTQISFDNVDTSNVTNMYGMFGELSNLTSLDLSNFDTSKVTKMGAMFLQCPNLTSLDLSSFNTSNVTSMKYMFGLCSNLTSLDLSGFNTSNVTNMNCMFYMSENLISLDLSGFDTSKVTDMDGMFYNCSNLTSLDLSGFNTSNVTNMRSMFYMCENLTSLDLSGFDTSNVTNMYYMFNNCPSLTNISVGPKWSTKNVTESHRMFYDCKKLPNYNASVTNITKAHTGPDGYLTLKQ